MEKALAGKTPHPPVKAALMEGERVWRIVWVADVWGPSRSSTEVGMGGGGVAGGGGGTPMFRYGVQGGERVRVSRIGTKTRHHIVVRQHRDSRDVHVVHTHK